MRRRPPRASLARTDLLERGHEGLVAGSRPVIPPGLGARVLSGQPRGFPACVLRGQARARAHTHTHTQRPQADHSHSSLFARGFAKRASPAMARAVCPVANSWQIRLGWARVGPPLGRARASPGAAQRKRTENMTKCGFYYGRFTIHRHLVRVVAATKKNKFVHGAGAGKM